MMKKIPVNVPEELDTLIEEMRYVVVKGNRILIYNTSDVVREILVKGIMLMNMEKDFLSMVMEKEAKKSAERAYTSLVANTPATKPQGVAGLGEALGLDQMEGDEKEGIKSASQ